MHVSFSSLALSTVPDTQKCSEMSLNEQTFKLEFGKCESRMHALFVFILHCEIYQISSKVHKTCMSSVK